MKGEWERSSTGLELVCHGNMSIKSDQFSQKLHRFCFWEQNHIVEGFNMIPNLTVQKFSEVLKIRRKNPPYAIVSFKHKKS